MAENENIRIADGWWNVRGEYQLTDEQYKRKRRGEPIWQKDKQIEPYKVNKGEWV